MCDSRYQPRLNELLGCSPRVVVALGQLQRAQVAAAVAAHARGASIARVSSSTIVPMACNDRIMRSGPMRDNRCQPVAERATGLLTTRGGGPGPAQTRVAAAVAVHGRGASISRDRCHPCLVVTCLHWATDSIALVV